MAQLAPDNLYREVNINEIQKYIHNAKQWRHWFDTFRSEGINKKGLSLPTYTSDDTHELVESFQISGV